MIYIYLFTEISDTDLVLFISSYRMNESIIDATPCYYDQFGRPIAGNININPHHFFSVDWKKNVQTMLRAFTRIVVMHSNLWNKFRDKNGNKMSEDKV